MTEPESVSGRREPRNHRVAAIIASVAAAVLSGSPAVRAAEFETVTFDFANAYFMCFVSSNRSKRECRDLWGPVQDRMTAERAAGVPAQAGVEFDGSAADCSVTALANNGYMIESILLMDYRNSAGTYVQLPAEKFTSVQASYALAVQHDLWPKFQAYYQRLEACNAS